MFLYHSIINFSHAKWDTLIKPPYSNDSTTARLHINYNPLYFPISISKIIQLLICLLLASCTPFIPPNPISFTPLWNLFSIIFLQSLGGFPSHYLSAASSFYFSLFWKLFYFLFLLVLFLLKPFFSSNPFHKSP